MNFSTQHQRKTISSLVSSLLKGTALGISMAMVAIVPSIPSILAQPDTGNSNNSTTPSALPGVNPSPAVNPSPGASPFFPVNPSRPTDRNTLNPLFLPQPTPSVPMNDTLPTPNNDNTGIPGAEIDLMEGNNVPAAPTTQLNNLLGLPENEPLPNSSNTNRRNSVNSPNNRTNNQNSNQPSQSNSPSSDGVGNSGSNRDSRN